MRQFDWYGCQAEIDVDTTRRWYETSPVWDCPCGHCRNFVALARDRRLPEEALSILDELGVPPEKATYVCELYHENGNLLYQVLYRLSGRPVKGEMRHIYPWGEMGLHIDVFEPSSAEDFPPPWFDLELNFWLPWALDEPIEGIPAPEIPSPKKHDIPITADIPGAANQANCSLIRKVIRTALAAEGVDFPCEVDVLLTGDRGIQAINREMREVDEPTDVLSFPTFPLQPGELPSPEDADPGSGLVPLGDMVISMERVSTQAREYNHSKRRELSYLVVHSVLHLLGYDHLDEGPEKARMRAREEAILGELGIKRG